MKGPYVPHTATDLVPDLVVPPGAWRDVSDSYTDNTARGPVALLAAVTIYGRSHHLEAFRVRQADPRHPQTAWVDDTAGELDRVAAACEGSDGWWETVHIPGYTGDWVLMLTPAS